MKTIFRFLSMTALIAGIAVTGAFAQDPCADMDPATALYTKFTETYNKKPLAIADREQAITAGKEFLEKYGACEVWTEQATFVKGWVPKLEKWIADEREAQAVGKLFQRFDAAITSDNADELYSAGKEILAKLPDNPNNINIKFPMAVVGPREVIKKNNKYNADSLRYAKELYDYLKGNGELTKVDAKGAKTNTIGALKHEMKREDAISELAFTLAYVNYYGQNNKKAAMPYFYEVAKSPGFRKDYPPVYATIGDFYIAEAAPIGAEIAEKIKKIQDAATPDEEKVKLNEEVKAKVALFNGYTERAMDAYSRAWSVAKDSTPTEKTYKETLLKEVQRLYELRFEKKEGVNQWITTAVAKPLPDPASTVQPVADEPATTTTTTGVGAANGKGVGAGNGTGVGTANGSGLGTPSGRTVGATPAPAKTKP